MQAVSGGTKGFAYVADILALLLQTLLQDEIAEVGTWPHYHLK